jgi:hypothetical protein
MASKNIHFQDIKEPYFISGKRAKARNRACSKVVDDGLEMGACVNPTVWFGSSQDCLEHLQFLLELRKERNHAQSSR